MNNIHSISEILNFRHNKKFLSRDWWGRDFPREYDAYSDNLKTPPAVYTHFKYVLHSDIHENSHRKNKDVFCYSNDQHLIKKLTSEHSVNFDNLVVMGDDANLSERIEELSIIRHRFSKIYYEAKDIACDWVHILPMGMNMAYMIRNGGNSILEYMNEPKNKSKLVASAFGSKWPHLTDKINDRRNLQNFTRNNNFVDDMFCNPIDYFSRLSEYKYFLCPLGNGIQTPKICECIMCEVVPIVTDHIAHRELRDLYDLPILVVEDWPSLTEQCLNDQWNQVHSSIEWDKHKRKYMVENFENLLYTHYKRWYP